MTHTYAIGGVVLAMAAVIVACAPARGLPESVPAAPTVSPALPARLEISLRNVLWQTLPDEVYTAFVGPDDRVWYVLQGSLKLPAAQALIEREFRQGSPQVAGLRPVLFEQDGRVWFEEGRRTLWGYDGRTWVSATLSTWVQRGTL